MTEARAGWGVAALALGGIFSSERDADGAAAALTLGEHAITGHLDPSIDDAAADLARRHGLAGFRFSGDSWWTEHYLDGKEDPGVGQERLDALAEAESWPWLSLVVAAPAGGAASEMAAIETGQALLGALVLLDQAPGTGWGEAVPWIAGAVGPAGDPRWPGDRRCDWTMPIQPQHVDAGTRVLDNAESQLGEAPDRVIDLAGHARGPAAELLAAVVDSSLLDGGPEAVESPRLAAACRLAWLAAAAGTATNRWSLARAAVEMLVDGEDRDLLLLAQDGTGWRLARAAEWPEQEGFGADADFDSWLEGLSGAATGMTESLASPSWGTEAARQSAQALGLVQALLFCRAAQIAKTGIQGA
ncbi:MAG TPA: hypothetical protein VLI94_00790 [Solirubrobacterales bacterium]|nr:hypothetical protein [Solirubrobacterales bacterium]